MTQNVVCLVVLSFEPVLPESIKMDTNFMTRHVFVSEKRFDFERNDWYKRDI